MKPKNYTHLAGVFVFLLFGLLSDGCTHAQAPLRQNIDGKIISIPGEEITAIEKEARQKHKLVVRWRTIKDENTIELFMADKPNRAHGIVIVYRKVDGKWQEDTAAQSEWII